MQYIWKLPELLMKVTTQTIETNFQPCFDIFTYPELLLQQNRSSWGFFSNSALFLPVFSFILVWKRGWTSDEAQKLFWTHLSGLTTNILVVYLYFDSFFRDENQHYWAFFSLKSGSKSFLGPIQNSPILPLYDILHLVYSNLFWFPLGKL